MLLNLINDLLDLAKIENDKFHLVNTQFNLHDVIQRAIHTLDFLAQQKKIKVSYEYDVKDAQYFMQIYGDENRYLQILINFISNALKFTERGNVLIQTKLIEHQAIKSNITNHKDFVRSSKVQLIENRKKLLKSKSLERSDKKNTLLLRRPSERVDSR